MVIVVFSHLQQGVRLSTVVRTTYALGCTKMDFVQLGIFQLYNGIELNHQ